MTPSMVEAFLANPLLILVADATSERDADAFAIQVSQYVAADASALPALVNVLPRASLEQRRAIGRGLYRTVDVCTAVDVAIAMRTQTAARKINDASVIQAYRAAETLATSEAAAASPPASDAPPPPSLIGDPPTGDPTSLKLSNPFVLPGIH